MLELYAIMRCHDRLVLDLSYTFMRYRGSNRLDDDMHFLFKSTDQVVTVESDFPEYTVQATVARLHELTQGIEQQLLDNATHRHLERFFAGYRVGTPA